MDELLRDVQSALLAHLRDHVLAEGVTISADTELPALDVDSVTIVELAMLVEERFGIEVPVHHLIAENTRTVAALARCIVTNGMPRR